MSNLEDCRKEIEDGFPDSLLRATKAWCEMTPDECLQAYLNLGKEEYERLEKGSKR